jgi:hypothetical protein
MLETLGLITLQEADSILEFNIQYDWWNDTNVYEQTTGTWNSHGTHNALHGTDTLALTELAANDLIAIQYETAEIVSIQDDEHITLDVEIHTVDSASLEIVTLEQQTNLIAMWLLKKKCLLTAYGYLTTFCNIPDPVPQVLKDAQCYIAANLYKTNGASTNPNGQTGNVKSYSIGDMSYTFNSSQSFAGNTAYEVFPFPIYDIIKSYLKNAVKFAYPTTSAR